MEKPVAALARKILLVDDNRVIRHLLRLTFADSQLFQVFEADSGEKALPIVLCEQPEIIILNVLMPGELNGFQISNPGRTPSIAKSFSFRQKISKMILSRAGKRASTIM